MKNAVDFEDFLYLCSLCPVQFSSRLDVCMTYESPKKSKISVILITKQSIPGAVCIRHLVNVLNLASFQLGNQYYRASHNVVGWL